MIQILLVLKIRFELFLEMERVMRFELTTSTLARLRSTPELHPHFHVRLEILTLKGLQEVFSQIEIVFLIIAEFWIDKVFNYY